MNEPVARVRSLRVERARIEETGRLIPEEVPVALVYDGSTHAVMMATPADLEDFALGFSLTEGIVKSASEITGLEIVEHDNGLEARMWLDKATSRTHSERRRRIAGPTACGLCGVESLEVAVPPPTKVGASARVSEDEIRRALAALAPAQTLNAATRAVHAAAFWVSTSQALAHVREDVGRHNALDKLIGALSRERLDPAQGFVVLTSRVSVEMVQKTAQLGAEIMVAVSAPTALAVRTAEAAGITLIAVARADAFEVFTRPERLILEDNKSAYRPGDHLHAVV